MVFEFPPLSQRNVSVKSFKMSPHAISRYRMLTLTTDDRLKLWKIKYVLFRHHPALVTRPRAPALNRRCYSPPCHKGNLAYRNTLKIPSHSHARFHGGDFSRWKSRPISAPSFSGSPWNPGRHGG